MKYNYRQAMIEDIKNYIIDNNWMAIQDEDLPEDELIDNLVDDLWIEDKITGNGPYWYDTEEKCSEYLSDNFDLLYEATREYYFDDTNILIHHYEYQSLARYFDCTIRCYLLPECTRLALESIK